jgi:UDP-N-acetylglucosamine--N-acetylmuramyl-(pentapeptide) pyrophosphoryl-undecaprenol N-acetylglucosamine transferase
VTQQKQKHKPLLLVGGGTGGHIFPLVAIGEELTARKLPFIYVGAKNGREEAIVAELGWRFTPIAAGKVRRYLTLSTLYANIIDLFRTVQGFFQAINLLIKTGAPAVISKGGYVAFPVVYAARLLGRPVYAHESDAVMGLTNRMTAAFAKRMFTAFSPKVYPKSDGRYLQVGIPIRKNLRQAARLRSPKKTRPIVLVLGGIQGASAINSIVRQSLNKLLVIADVVHVTGEKEFAAYQKVLAGLDKSLRAAYKPYSFLDRELAYYFQAADLVVSRASATTIAEGALFGKAMLLIPLPTAAGNHQVINAKILVAEHAAVVQEEYQLSPETFTERVEKLLGDSAELSTLGIKLRGYFHNDDAIAIILSEVYGEKNGQ